MPWRSDEPLSVLRAHGRADGAHIAYPSATQVDVFVHPHMAVAPNMGASSRRHRICWPGESRQKATKAQSEGQVGGLAEIPMAEPGGDEVTGSSPPEDPAGTGRQDEVQHTSIFRRGEVPLAHTVYGLILALATVGELIHHEVSAAASVAWLLGASAVLLGAHLFSDVLAALVATQDDPNWSEIVSIGNEDVSVVYGGVGSATIMAVAAFADLDSENALLVSVGAGLLALAALCFYGLSHHRLLPRFLMTATAVAFGAVIVLLENTI